MKHIVLSLAAKLWLTFAIVLVLIAVALTAVRFWLPLAVGHGRDVEQLFSDYLGRPVQVGRIDARWGRWGPEFSLDDVRVLAAEGQAALVHVRQVRVAVDLLSSLRQRRLQPYLLTVVGLRLTVDRPPGGGLRLAGLGSTGEGDSAWGPQLVFPWLLAQDRVALERGELILRDQRTGAAISFTDLGVSLRNQDGRHQIDASATVVGGETGRTALAADLYGGADPQQWHGQFFLQGTDLELHHLLAEVPGAPTVGGGTVSGKAWGDWGNGHLQRLEGWIELHDLPPLEAAEVVSAAPTRVGAEFRWERLPDSPGWRLALDRVRFDRPDTAWPETRMQLVARHDTDGTPQSWRFAADFLEIGAFLPWAQGWLPAGPLADALAGTRPNGRLRDVDLLVRPRLGSAPEVLGTLRLQGLQTQPWRRVPGIHGIGGVVALDAGGGSLELADEPVRLDAPHLFRGPLTAEHVAGRLAWRRAESGWVLESDNWRLANPDVWVRGGLRVALPGSGAVPSMWLAADFGDGNGSRVSPYLPAGIMPDRTVEWLDRSLLGGRVPSGTLLFDGPLGKFPFEEGEGRFEVRFEVREAVLDYSPGWPRIEGIDGQVAFVGRGMEIHAQRGRIFDTEIVAAEATIADLKAKPALLQVRGSTRGAAADGLRFLAESPLRDRFQGLTSGVEVTEPVDTRLDLLIPLAKGERASVSGSIAFDGNRVEVSGWDVELRKVRGELSFTDDGVSGQAIAAELLGSPATIDVRTEVAQEARAFIVTAHGRLDDAALRERLHHPVFGFMSGEAAYQANLWLRSWRPGTPLEVALQVESDLAGMAVRLPAPLAKAAATSESLWVSTNLVRDGPARVTVRYGKRMSLVGEFERDAEGWRVGRGSLVLGGEAELPREPGLTITGRVAVLPLGDWVAAVAEWTASSASRDTGPAGSPRIVGLRVDALQALGQAFSGVTLDLAPDANGWRADLQGKAVAGQVRWSERGKPVVVDLERLQLGTPQPAGGSAPENEQDPAALPPLQVSCKALSVGGRPLGRMRLETAPTPQGLALHRLHLDHPQLQIRATGSWRKERGGQRSRLDGTLTSPDLGRALQELGYAVGLAEGKTNVDFKLGWPGGPQAFSVGKLDGTLKLQVDNGRLVEVKPGVGRIFGLLSVQTLPRRLTLDFRDLFKQGFAFDQMSGSFRIDSGDAYTNDFSVEGPAARIEVSGRVGLQATDYDQLVTVVPHLGGSLSVAGALAGGPAVGAVVFLAQKLFEPQIEQLTRYQYTLTGTWENPVLTRLQRFDRSGREAVGSP